MFLREELNKRGTINFTFLWQGKEAFIKTFYLRGTLKKFI